MDNAENKSALPKNEEEEKQNSGISRKNSEASLLSMDTNEEDDDGNEEEDDEKNVVVPGPQVALKEQLEMDKDDESLRRWKETLLANVDLSEVGENPDPLVTIMNLTISSPERADLVLPIPFQSGSNSAAFVLKDGSKYCLKFNVTVHNNIVSGLRYTNTVWKKGIRVDYKKVMLGTFSPQKDAYVIELEEETTPSGFLARGYYTAKTKFADDDGKCYLEMDYAFEIKKDWGR
ncbi:Rho GDP-dissociation inhibitor 1 [Rhynchospora pubera]|uniref:Rho GDP-dissociation inhibitor 1 n=1 Tax=Rhynchospora pubera TaxID=906938 RepID=A0AAV8CPW9_9POAL|nr:Rho GDP-dissociation inhibitor 1 [Rhynchospora pubera]